MHTHTQADSSEREGWGGILARELRPAVLGGRVRCLMRQRDVKTDSYNEMSDGHAAEKDTIAVHTRTEVQRGGTKLQTNERKLRNATNRER